MGYLAFDIEIAKQIPDIGDWKAHRSLGISCAATWAEESREPRLWFSPSESGLPASKMTCSGVSELVQYLVDDAKQGQTIVTWNGLGFDFENLAEESNKLDECKLLAQNHVDLMFHAFCALGHPISLAKAAEGMGIRGKFEGLSGVQIPGMWANGEHKKVLDYVSQDAKLTLDVAKAAEDDHGLLWKTRSSSVRQLPLPNGWLSAKEAMNLPEPDNSWMDEPWSRSKFSAWLTDG